MSELDHLVYAVPDLGDAVEEFERSTGVRPAFGGAHPGMGTHNALVSFGASYLELIAPDPGQPDPRSPRPFGIDDMAGRSRLVTFAVHPSERGAIEQLVDNARTAGYDPGDPVAMSRLRPDGIELHWRLTFPTGAGDGLVPFVIDWGDTDNPAHTAPSGIELVAIRWTHPDPPSVVAARTALGFDKPVEASRHAAIEATLRGPTGDLVL